MTMLWMIAAALAVQTPAAADVAAAVETSFPERDLNGDGTLSRAEFGAWLAELKAKSARARADSPETRAWVTAAFSRADRDRNAGVSEAELTGFLTGRS
jgi:hypothetical protein